MKWNTLAVVALVAALGFATPALAQADEAEAKAIVNSIDAEAGQVNVTHEPMPAIGWPKMTMDMPVTRSVDLSTVKPGSEVTIKVKKGRDNQYRITDMTAAE